MKLNVSAATPEELRAADRTPAIRRLMDGHPKWRRNRARTQTSPSRTLRNFFVIPPSRLADFAGSTVTRNGELDHSHLEWRRRLLEDCLSHVPGEANLQGGALVDGNEPLKAFRGLWSLPSHSMPLTLPPLHQRSKTERFARPEHRRLYDALTRFFFQDAPFVSVTHPAGGTTSVPEWSSDPARKQELVFAILGNLTHVRDLLNGENWEAADRLYDVFNCTFLQTRRQAEDPDKPRKLVTWPFLLGQADQPLADKRIDGVGDFGRCRLRLVYALNAGINWPFSTYQLYPFLKSFLSAFEFAYKPRGPEDMARRLQWGNLTSIDVEQFDNNTPSFLIERFFEAFATRVGEEWAYPSIASLYSPLVAPPTTPEGELLALGHPYERPLPFARGIPSGHSANVPLGRLIGTFVQLVPLLDMGLITVPQVAQTLRGDHPRVRIMNSSDDAAYSFRSRGDLDAFHTHLSEEGHPYFDVAPEPYFQYLGHVAVQSRKGGRVEMRMRASSYLINLLSPERSTQGQLRRFPWTGFSARESLYHAHGTDQVHLMQACIARAVRALTRVAWQELIEREASFEAQSLTSWADRVAAANPDAVHYLVDESELSPLARERLGWTIGSDVLERHYTHLNPSRS